MKILQDDPLAINDCDSLAHGTEAVQVPHIEEATNEQDDHDKIPQYTPGELQRIVSQRHTVSFNEDMDPIEWTVRKVVPIPAAYYWKSVSVEQHKDVPLKVKVWHKTIAALWGVHQWTDRRIARPVAQGLGLTDSRFDYVTDHMTAEEWERSKEMAAERRAEHEKDEPTIPPAPTTTDHDEEQTETSKSSS